MRPYKTVGTPAEAEFTEKRSRFLSALAPVRTPGEAAAFLAARRELHYDARHTVFAYRLREGNIDRCSDDGEPQGTGGQPVLEVLRRNELEDVCLAVTRYFGGILLGTGGLTRAYSNSASLAVAAAEIVTMCPCVLCTAAVDYALYGAVQRLLPAYGCRVLDTAFAEGVTLSLQLPEERFAPFCDAVREATSGAGLVAKTGCAFGAI